MAPTRLASKSTGVNENINSIMNQGITTRSKQMATLKTYKDNLKVTNKRKADSPLKNMTAKRAAFGDITNAFNKSTATNDKVTALKKVTVESKLLPTVKSIKPQPTIVNNKTTKSKQIQKAATNALESIQKHFAKDPPKPVATRAKNGILKNIERKSISNENKEQNQSQNSTKSGRSDVSGEPSLYVTALENITPSDITKEEYKAISEKLNKVNLDDSLNRSLDEEREEPHRVPDGVADIDRENWNDPFQVSNYAMDIFNYLKSRERLFPIDDYLQRLKDITSWMRALLVDWMVEVQESFELNHETLYLAVKLVDLFLTRSTKTKPEREHLTKEELQLLGASALFIASKFDERIPPTVDDFLYICDGAYTLAQLLKMEINILRVVDFDLGIPLSYSFLRRYARCARVSMPTLTLARFVLEQCLLEYTLVAHSDSKMAAAALYIALRIKSLGSWTPALQYYTGYSLEDIMPVVLAQNAALHKKPKSAISTVRNKYSHTTFFEVAKLPLVEDSALATLTTS
ncbi:PREDICTED: G2/mitotic-specific cyclin-B3 [Papilio xuthus]|uniref:G2/mitotic-specific cyclin-B3 n=1 Tax=Papilio xuthus TaxID=66420 RepID=A0A194QH62_PAPXU|nr:PREDICTED: G2/mitotic-specific cyclin-B3 [Papilio xuthus]KPJ04754.1 G2/mitotic-specific cyclin-B3 [Papilio xuthus]